MTAEAPGKITLLRLFVDGRRKQMWSEPERPWVARITGHSDEYRYEREFVDPLTDWGKTAWSNKTRDRVLYYPLRNGVYEVHRYAGSSRRKRHPERVFVRVYDGQAEDVSEQEVIAWLSKKSG